MKVTTSFCLGSYNVQLEHRFSSLEELKDFVFDFPDELHSLCVTDLVHSILISNTLQSFTKEELLASFKLFPYFQEQFSGSHKMDVAELRKELQQTRLELSYRRDITAEQVNEIAAAMLDAEGHSKRAEFYEEEAKKLKTDFIRAATQVGEHLLTISRMKRRIEDLESEKQNFDIRLDQALKQFEKEQRFDQNGRDYNKLKEQCESYQREIEQWKAKYYSDRTAMKKEINARYGAGVFSQDTFLKSNVCVVVVFGEEGKTKCYEKPEDEFGFTSVYRGFPPNFNPSEYDTVLFLYFQKEPAFPQVEKAMRLELLR